MKGADAETACSAFLALKDVERKSGGLGGPSRVRAVRRLDRRDRQETLGRLLLAPRGDNEWPSDLVATPLPGASYTQYFKAGDKTIVGSAMNGNLLKAVAEAYHQAISSIHSESVTSAADYETVHAAFGRAIASVRRSRLRPLTTPGPGS